MQGHGLGVLEPQRLAVPNRDDKTSAGCPWSVPCYVVGTAAQTAHVRLPTWTQGRCLPRGWKQPDPQAVPPCCLAFERQASRGPQAPRRRATPQTGLRCARDFSRAHLRHGSRDAVWSVANRCAKQGALLIWMSEGGCGEGTPLYHRAEVLRRPIAVRSRKLPIARARAGKLTLLTVRGNCDAGYYWGASTQSHVGRRPQRQSRG